ncbi:T-cell differentiation antigen CD6-like isoform X1 [Pygocentrus nattereri]|uniref:SRCR domain-containing protein n=1 Tax=Pygocentrus nattereri TaxID=42514 RepID=A0AAR2LK50_PYGNA|nr:T-cell differentiation antigen CD6-like isoform X1 [Pygocentrus nattereri]XP_017537703.1 T-cell differentiation antigen CD6-like isoform X1 [Pygocentrus nattereri]XP_017537704.1 T-cell differentiation antigen CD6-like isoform X1 [Pygocentrus nattereri]XP_017537705.1 T-cell differentiation antigen CD6-like isoform X1 [Pygocentrus nattereri]XP_017537706.1 T-cell differentiation antigen CD6-like isoform X1 [Pygocentrus nattereri]XP_017537708.1 T-cell differentiation antigen CD6-like isoform X1
MEAFRIVVVLQALVCCEALQNLTTPKSPDGKESNLYVSQTSRPCSWTVSSRGENQSLAVFTEGSLDPLAAHVCETLGCGKVYKIITSAADPNVSCFTSCIYHNDMLKNCSQAAGGSCRAVSEVVCAAPYITATSGYCVWNLRSLQNEPAVILTEEAARRLSSEVCQSHGCGDALPQSRTRVPPNSTCLTGCVYHNLHLRNCSTVVSSDCTQLSTVECGNHLARLSGGSHRCSGRVELWRGGQWGTVCDDEWDKKDADVVCAQLGCGYAISVSGQGQPYGQGRGPIHLDELNCTGKERSLWECPAVKEHHDCGHKEDAGVVCSEYKALRLTGGLDRCSGRVEIHRNGSWGTVCDDSWAKEEASMACGMLGCGSAVQFTGFDEPFSHKNGTRWFYMCKKPFTNLWECTEYAIVKSHMCTEIKAAGLVCSDSQGLPKPTSPKATTPALTTVPMTTAGPIGFWTLELLGCIGLSCALLIALITNVILCCVARKKRALKVQQQYASLQTAAGAEENNYRDGIHLVKVTNNEPQLGAQIVPPQMWTQSSVESGDTDYDPSDSGPDTPFPLSTFRNSMRYSAESRNPALKGANLHCVTEEDSGAPGDAAMQGHQQQPYTANGTFHGLTAAPSEDSFDTSSTSSGEIYENTGLSENYENTGDDRNDLQTATLPYPDPPSYSTENLLNQPDDSPQNQSNGFISNQGFGVKPSYEDDSPIYSPVSADVDPYTSDSDYDDVGCLQRPH